MMATNRYCRHMSMGPGESCPICDKDQDTDRDWSQELNQSKLRAALAAAQQQVRELEDEHETTLIALGNMTAAWDRQMNEIAELKADNARLREIVERLPVTADGVVVIPRWDEELWHPEYGECEPYRSNDDRWIVFSDCDRTGIRPFGLVSDCYSTREAAEAAREVQS